MANATYGVTLAVGTVSIAKTISRTGNHENSYSITLPAGKAGSLTTRTDDDTGVIACTGHGLSVGDDVDVYWSGGMRYGMKVSSSSGANEITVGTAAGDVGAGDVFPAAATALVVTKQVSINTAIDGDAIEILGIVAEYTDSASTSKAHIDMRDAGAATIEEIDLTANVPVIYDVEGGATNVFTGNVITVSKASSGSVAAATLKIACLENA